MHPNMLKWRGKNYDKTMSEHHEYLTCSKRTSQSSDPQINQDYSTTATTTTTQGMPPEGKSRRRFKSPYWDVPPVGFEQVTPKQYKAMQAAGQIPHSVVNPSSQHLQGTRFAHGHNPTAAPPPPSLSPSHHNRNSNSSSSNNNNNQQSSSNHHSSHHSHHKSSPPPDHSSSSSSHHHRSRNDDNNGSSSSYNNGSSSRGRHPDPVAAAKSAAANINAMLASGGITTSTAGASRTMLPALTRQARRLYVGNIPFGSTDDDMIEFFRSNMEACNFVTQPGNPVLACQINLDKNFAFLEFRSVEETTHAMALDGIQCKGQTLKVKRPYDYQPVPGSEPTPAPIGGILSGDNSVPHIPGVVSTIVADSPNKIYIGGIPTHLTDDQIKDLLSSFGQLRAFNLIRDPSTSASKGYAFCEFLDPLITDQAIVGLNGFDICDKKLIVQRASVGAKSGPLAAASGTNLIGISAAATAALLPPVQIQVPGLPCLTPNSTPRVLTEILCLMNMVDPDELVDDEEYRDILEDIEDECSKYGTVRSIEIPRPPRPKQGETTNSERSQQVPGLGKVFVEFNSITEAQRAQQNLAGRRFSNRVVVTSYFDRERYKNKDF